MVDDLTPIEGKGDEMIPNRGLPFEEVSEEEEYLELENVDFTEPVSIDEILEEVPVDLSGSTPENSETNESILYEETHEATSQLLDLQESLDHENEITYDTGDTDRTLTDFDEESGGDFAGEGVPASSPDAGGEAIMLESSSELLDEEVVFFEEGDGEISNEVVTEDFSPSVTQPESPGEEISSLGVPTSETTNQEALFTEGSFKLPGPAPEEHEVQSPETAPDLKASKKLLDLLVTNKRVEALWLHADDLQSKVVENIEDISIARTLLEHIRSARTRILEKKENYEEAERELNEVEFRLSYNRRSQDWRSMGYRIFVYEVLWGIIFMTALGFLLAGSENILRLNEGELISRTEIYIGLGGLLMGGIGGVVGALHALWRYITSQKFNPQFNIWYLSQPIMGLFIGAFIFLFIKIGFNVTAGNASLEIGSPWMVYILAFIAGYQQNVLYDIIKQVLKLFKIGSDDSKGEETRS
jgi:hypothetical protein